MNLPLLRTHPLHLHLHIDRHLLRHHLHLVWELLVRIHLGHCPFWVQLWPLGSVGHRQSREVVVHLPQETVLGLLLLRKLTPLADGRVLEVHLPLEPLAPTFPRVYHWVSVYLLLLYQKVGHIVRIDLLGQILQEYVVVDIPVVKILPQLLIIQKVFQLLVLHPLVNIQGSLVEPSQNSILHRQQPARANFLCICSNSKQVPDSLGVIPLRSPHQGSLPIFRNNIDISFVLLHKELTNLRAAINRSPMQGSGFVVDSEGFIDNLRFVLQHPLYVLDLLSLYVPVQVLVP